MMKKSLFYLVIGLLVGGLVTGWMIYRAAPGMMLIETESPFGFDETVNRFESAVEQANWKIPAKHNLQKSMEKAGFEVEPVVVYELCHPKHAAKILKEDDERIVSSMMPCRVSIYMKSDGKVYFSRMNSKMMADMMGGLIAEVMSEAYNENEIIINNTLR